MGPSGQINFLDHDFYFDERVNTMKRFALIFLMIAAANLSACNTMQGVGKDVQKAGEKLEDAAKKK
jgi:entericidin A